MTWNSQFCLKITTEIEEERGQFKAQVVLGIKKK